jgi:hypothetical protein
VILAIGVAAGFTGYFDFFQRALSNSLLGRDSMIMSKYITLCDNHDLNIVPCKPTATTAVRPHQHVNNDDPGRTQALG